MPAHPVSRLVRFTLAVGTNVIFDHLGHRRPTVHPVRVIEATELLALDVFNTGRRQITLSDVEHYIHTLRSHPPECQCGRCAAAAIVRPDRVLMIVRVWQRRAGVTRLRARR
jgi:hypothetical protein